MQSKQMALVRASNLPNVGSLGKNPIAMNVIWCSFSPSFPWCKIRLRAVKTESDGSGAVQSSQELSDLLRRPGAPSPVADDCEESGQDDSADGGSEEKSGDTWVDWEDQILEDTVPLVGFVKMILHSGKYDSGDRLSPEHERTILERLLPCHPDCEKKIGCGVDYITTDRLPS